MSESSMAAIIEICAGEDEVTATFEPREQEQE